LTQGRRHKPLRLLHIIPRFIGGGPERSLLAFAAEERRAGLENRHTVAVLDPPVSLPMLLAARKLGIVLVSRPDRDALSRLVEHADIVVIHFWNHPKLDNLLRRLALPPARVVLWSRVLGLHPPQVLTDEVARFGDLLLVTARRTLETDGAGAAMAGGVPVRHIPGIADMTRLAGFQPRPHEGTVVGYIGVVADTKMHPRFAEMSAAVRRDVDFVVCGGGGDEAVVTARFAALGAEQRLSMRGPVEDIRRELEGFDIFGYPLAADTYATSEKALQEAMWAGIPPVVFPHGGVRDLVADGDTGLVVASEGAYTAAIERLVDDTPLRRRLGARALRFAREAFDPARWVHELDAQLRGMMDAGRRTRATLGGAYDEAARNFVRSLGGLGPFADSLALAPGSPGRVAADARIAAASPILARGEGGVIHYANTYPDDPDLRRWARLIAGRHVVDTGSAARPGTGA